MEKGKEINERRKKGEKGRPLGRYKGRKEEMKE